MTRFNLKMSIFLAVIAILSSCTIEKRQHLSGYHIDWHKNNRNAEKIARHSELKMETESVGKLPFIKNEQLLASKVEESTVKPAEGLNNLSLVPNTEHIEVNQYVMNDVENDLNLNDDCDLMTLKNGDDVQVKVIEIGQSEIKYKKCDNLNGPLIAIRKSEVFSIKYPNGSKEMISSTSNSAPLESLSEDGDKSFIVAVLLWFFLGLLGIHRFYLGHIGIGVLYLLTGGLCGIGWIVDGILLLTGNLKPKDGDYVD